MILLPETSYAQALECAERIRQGVAEYNLQISDTVTLKITISIGVTHVDVRALESLENAINRADKALYQAKESGRNRVCGAEIFHS